MKKMICILICLAMVLTLMGCSHLTEEGKVIAKNAVEIAEQFLQGDITVDDASSKLKDYRDQSYAMMPDLEDRDGSVALFALQTFVNLLYMDISTGNPEDKIKEHLNELKKLM